MAIRHSAGQGLLAQLGIVREVLIGRGRGIHQLSPPCRRNQMTRVGLSHLNDRHPVAHNLDLLARPDPVDDSGKLSGHLGRTQTRHGDTLSDLSDTTRIGRLESPRSAGKIHIVQGGDHAASRITELLRFYGI
jgi:hypothetical protein